MEISIFLCKWHARLVGSSMMGIVYLLDGEMKTGGRRWTFGKSEI